MSWAAIAVAVLVLAGVAAIAAFATGLVGGEGEPVASATTSPAATVSEAPASSEPASASPVASAAASAPVSGLSVDGLARTTVSGLNVRRTPTTSGDRLGSLVAGEIGMILDGPTTADGTEWVLLAALGLPPNAGCEAPFTTDPFNCPSWLGWVAVRSPDDSTAWLEPLTWDCPDPGDYAEFAALTPVLQIACTPEGDVTLTAWWAGPDPLAGCIDAPPGVDWLFCPWAFGGALSEGGDDPGRLNLPITVDPASGVTLPPPGRPVVVSGHFDDPASADCAVVPGNPGDEVAGMQQVLQCRSTLVIESIADAP